MGRAKKKRLIRMAPHFAGFTPEGVTGPAQAPVEIGFDEYEAVKLCDYELLTQAEAAGLMNVSRPTFTRVYESARRKIAEAFVLGRPVRFETGDAGAGGWQRCPACRIAFTPDTEGTILCPFCGNPDGQVQSDGRPVRIAVADDGEPGMPVAPHFGRSRGFRLFDAASGKTAYVENRADNDERHAGSRTAEMLAGHGVRIVVAGRFGAKSLGRLGSLRIRAVVPDGQQTIHDIINRLKQRAMKIAIPTRDGRVDDHFGHCQAYSIFTAENDRITDGPEILPSPQGCGCKSNIASVLREMGITVMLAGNMGQGALNVLNSQGIAVYRGCAGDVREVAEAFLRGAIADSGEGCHSHGGDGEGHVCSHGRS